MFVIRLLFFTRIGLALTAAVLVAAFVAFAVYVQPAWIIDPLRGAAADVLTTMGAGLGPLILWTLGVLVLFKFGFAAAVRRWRYVVGSGLLVAGGFAVMSYFTWEFPLIGEAPLGGEIGGQLRGGGGVMGVLRTSALLIAGARFAAPRAVNDALGRASAAIWSSVAQLLKDRAAARERERQRAREVEIAQGDSWRRYTPNPDSHFSVGIDTVDAEPPDFLKDLQRSRRRPRYSEAQAFPTPPPSGPRNGTAPAADKPPAQSPAAAWGLLSDAPARGGGTPAPNAPAVAVQPAPMEADQEPSAPEAPNHSAQDAGHGEPAAAEHGPAASEPPDHEAETSDHSAHAAHANGVAHADVPVTPAGPPVVLPPLELLAPPVPAVAVSDEHEQTARDIEDALGQYGVEVQVREIRPGPSVTMFGLAPGWKRERAADEQYDRGSRVKVNSILARKNDLALALRSPALRLEAVPGESLVVVETPDARDANETAELIVGTLAEHGVDVTVREVRRQGDGFLFGLEPGWTRRARTPEPAAQQAAGGRVRVQSILAREKDLALALAAPSLRIQAPVPGESIVGIEVPNKSSSLVTIRTVMESDEYRRASEADGLPVALGLAPAGEPVAIDLAKMPHLLIAGSTGSGKSVCMNTIICSLIKDQPPSRVRLLLVDPKRVELTPYNGIPHLVTPVVVEPEQVVRLLRGAVQEMNRRYKLLEEAGARNIQSYNKTRTPRERLPFFVICIDELADLMMTAPADVETCLVRLAQLARAVGIHLVVATQRPSVNVITGLIKANFPSRIAFYVASQIDSRTILDFGGAESLLGRGDMLFLSSDSPKARRVQGVFISEEETAALGDHWREQPPDPDLQEIPLEEMAREAEVAEAESDAAVELDENDSLYDRALQVAAANRQLSTSLLQRRLRIGYPRAARLMDQLEDDGIVAATGDPGKPREVIYLPDA